MVLFKRRKIFCVVLIISTFVYSESTPTNIGNLTENEDDTNQTENCSVWNCENGGTCVKQGNSSHCTCRNGTSGDLCEIVDNCENNLCGNSSDAKCYFDVLEGTAFCKCFDKDSIFDYKRKTCRRNCSVWNCENGGTCVNQGNSSHCMCRYGTTGDLCEIVDNCENNLCGNSSDARCFFDMPAGSALCKCFDKDLFFDYQSKTCRSYCSMWECENGGTCVNQGNPNRCICRNGTSGDFCEIVDECEENLCENFAHPKCYFDVLEGKAACECYNANSIFDHKEKICRSTCNKWNPCRNGGKCVNVGNYGLCSCLNGTLGDLCTIVEGCMGFEGWITCGADISSICYFDVEKGKAACKCRDEDKIYDSEIKTCIKRCDASKNDCKHGGKCKGDGNDTICSCRNGTYGDFCEKVRDCEDPSFCGNRWDALCYFDESKGTGVCKCLGRNVYNAEKKICIAPNDSSIACKTNCGAGTCFKTEEGEVCVCPHTHFYNGETCIDKCDPNPCQNGGMCYLYRGNSTCLCIHPHSGVYCKSDAIRPIYSVVIYCIFAAGIIVVIVASCCALRDLWAKMAARKPFLATAIKCRQGEK